MLITLPHAPTLPFERVDGSGEYAPLSNTKAVPFLAAPSAGPAIMGTQTGDVTSFTQAGEVWVLRGSDLRAGDRFTYQARKYVLMGARNWDMDHAMTGADFGWMMFAFQVDPKQLVADVLALRGQSITLVPIVGTEGAGGGADYGPGTARAPQLFVVNNTQGLDGREDSQADQGLSRKFAFHLLGAADAAIALGDTWEDDVATYTVESIDRTNPYNVEALVTGFLKVAGHSFG